MNVQAGNTKPRRSLIAALLACLACGAAALAAPASADAAKVNLAVSQIDNPDPVQTGQVLTYMIGVSNNGPDPAKHVRLIDTIPAKSEFVAAGAGALICGHNKRRITCPLGTIPARQTITVGVQVRVIGTAQTFRVRNVASVGNRKTDPHHANNTSREWTTVHAPPPVMCAGRRATIVGTSGNDALVGTPGRDVIAGVSGNDDILGLGGPDIICGSGGKDTIRGGGGGDLIKGGGGKDDIAGGDETDLLFGKGGRDKLRGGRGGDALRGGHGRDRCRGGGGADSKRSC